MQMQQMILQTIIDIFIQLNSKHDIKTPNKYGGIQLE